MLNAMRENFRHLKWVLWIVAISMVLYLGYYFGGGSRSQSGGADADWAAYVDESPISSREFLEAARRADEYYRQILGAQYEQLKKQLQLGRQVVQSLVDRRVMVAEAKELGLSASPAEVSREIVTQPQFKDDGGRFVGKERYAAMVNRSYPGGVPAFESSLAEEITISKWRNLVTEPVEVSDQEVLDTYRTRSQHATLDLVVVPTAAQEASTKLTDVEVRSWYDAHPGDYQRGEGRRIRFVVIERQAEAAKVTVTDDEVKAYYEQNRPRFERPEQRRVRHILFKVEKGADAATREAARKQAEAALERIKKGEDFATLARTLSQDPGSAAKGGDVGFFGRGQMVPPFEQAAFSTPPGQLAPIVESDYGFHVMQVTDARPAGTVPLDEVKDGIKRQLELQKAQEAVQAEAARIRQAAATPKDLDAVAMKEKLKIQEKVVTKETPPQDLGPSPEFMDTVLQMIPGTVSQPLPVAAGMAIVAAVDTTKPSTAPFEDVRDKVRTDLLNLRAREAALAAARKAFGSSTDLAAAAKVLKTDVKSGIEFAPGRGIPGVGRSAELEKIVFGPSAKEGDRGIAETQSGAVIYSIVKREVYDPAKFETAKAGVRNELLSQRKQAVLQSILDGARQRHKVRINEELVDRVKG